MVRSNGPHQRSIFYYNNIPRGMIEKYQDEENHFKKLDLTARKLEKSVNHERRSTQVSAGDFTHNILLRAVTALEFILRSKDQNLVSQLHGINSRLSAAKFSVKEWTPIELCLVGIFKSMLLENVSLLHW